MPVQPRLIRVFVLFILAGIFSSALAGQSQAAARSSKLVAAGSKKKFNSNLYEQEAGGSVSGKVKAVREIQEETEVFLDAKSGGSGPYILPQNTKNRATYMKILTRSQKAGGPSVTLELDDQQRIKSVTESETPSDQDKPGEKWEL